MIIWRDTWGVPHLREDSHLALAWAQGRNAAQDRPRQLASEQARAAGTTAAVEGPTGLDWDRLARQARLDDTARRCFTALDDETAAWVAAYVDGVNSVEGFRWETWTPIAIWVSHHLLFAGVASKLWREVAGDAFATDGLSAAGSNGWMTDGVLAGDPHRYLEDPGVYQQVRLACDEYDVVGLAVPGVPGVAHFGHTGSVAWAITNAMADYQDLYRDAPVLSRHVEQIDVAGTEPADVEVVETTRGPQLFDGLSLRTPVRELADCGFAALPALLRARTVNDIDAALDGWVEPVNVVLAADTAGGRLHRVAGRVPVRPRPGVPLTPEVDWTGWEPMPRRTVDGPVVMANERSIAADLGVEFAPPDRAARIAELLAEGASPEQVHTDTLLASADALVSLLPPGPVADELHAWDKCMDADSTQATLFAALRHAVVRRLAALPRFAALTEIPCPSSVLAPWLALAPRIGYALPHLLPLVPEAAAVVSEAALEVAALPRVTWGSVHRMAPWQVVATDEAWPGCGGDHDCVLSTSSVPGVTDFFLRGPAARYVWDVADRARSRWVVPLGATEGDRDQLPLWLAGQLVPVVTDWDLLTEEKDA